MHGYLYILGLPHPRNNHSLNIHSAAVFKTHPIHRRKSLFLPVLPLILFDFVRQLCHLIKRHVPLRHLCTDLPHRMHDRRVVAPAQLLPNPWQRHIRQLTQQIHGDLPGIRKRTGA